MSALLLFNALNNSNIVGATGHTVFELQGLRTQITGSSVVGNIIQEWLAVYMAANNIAYRVAANTQEFPDYFLNPSSDVVDLLEVKCFTKAPNFDVANFKAYARSLLEYAYRLDSDYLIFEYRIVAGVLIVKNLWLKKVWEICSASDRSAVKIQWKQSVPVAIRPAVWYANRSSFPPFSTRRDFVMALSVVVNTAGVSPNIQKNWFKRVEQVYQRQTGNIL